MNLGFGISTEVIDDVKTVLARTHGAAHQRPFYLVADAWRHHSKQKNPNNVNFIHCHLDPTNEKYTERYLTSTAWYDYEFVNAFIALVQLSYQTLLPNYKSSSVHAQMIRTHHP
jgi:hypothetical protein